MKSLKTSATWLLIMLFLVNVVSYLDRQVLAIVQESIKEEFSWTDGQLGWLQMAFGLALAFSAIPIGRLADRVPRKQVLVACLTLWSAATIVAGTAVNFVHMLLARIGVGVGEAGVTPTAYALISDKFTMRRRATALAVCGAGISVGVALSLILGGMISEALNWRWAFILFGIPGLLLALVIAFTVQAPARGEADGVVKPKTSSLTQSLTRLFSSRSFTFVIIGTALKSIAGAGILNWMPSYLQRRYDLGEGDVGLSFGIVVGISALVSSLIAAYIADKMSERDKRWYAWIVVISQLLALPLILLAIFSVDYTSALILFAIATLFANSMLAISNALVQNTSPVQMRSMASAVKSMALTFLGFGIGSLLIGQLSANVFNTGDEGLDLMWALAVAACFHLAAAAAYWFASFTLRQDIEKAKVDSGLDAPTPAPA